MQSRSLVRRLAPLAIALAIVFFDRLTKVRIQHALTNFDVIAVIPGWLRIVHTENAGAAFGVLADGDPVLRGFILIGVSTLVLAFVMWALWSRKSGFTTVITQFGLSLILGGAAGNLYDRVVHRTVTDFIEVYNGDWSFPAFNVADSAITVGAVFLLFDLLRAGPKTYGESARIAGEYRPVERKP